MYEFNVIWIVKCIMFFPSGSEQLIIEIVCDNKQASITPSKNHRNEWERRVDLSDIKTHYKASIIWKVCIGAWINKSVCCCSVAKSYLTRCSTMDRSTPGFPSFTDSWSLLKFMSNEPVMLSNHLIFCHPLLLFPSIIPSIGVSSSNQVAKVLDLQLQHQSFQRVSTEWTEKPGTLQSMGWQRVGHDWACVHTHTFLGK